MERATTSSDEEQNVDRLSALPDGVICHILSFLPTRRSVQTSILAKRWRFLWAHVPFINLQGDDASSHTTTSFSGIVCTVLLRHKAQTLNTFRLTYWGRPNDQCNAYELETCIATVVDRNVQKLHLRLLRVEVPRCLLTCKTLVELTMIDDVRIPPSAPVSLPSLKKLNYRCSKLGVDLARLLSGCPVLEDFTFRGYPLSSCNISSPTLKRITMEYLMGIENHPEYLVKITAPALRYLKVNDCSYKRISVLPSASLVEARISLKTSLDSDDYYPRRVLKYVDSFCNAKCLTIWGRDAKFPDSEMVDPYVRFGNLTKLQLSAIDWRLLTKFLQSADQLEDLVFNQCETPETSESWTEPMEEKCACLLHSLKTVTIYAFNCTDQDCTMVKFILRNARVLKRMEIHCQQHDLQTKFNALQQIALVRRGSMECELVFC